MIRTFYLVLFALLLVACSKKTAIVDTVDNAPQEQVVVEENIPMGLPVDDRVITGTLDNGLKYYIQKNSKPENRAELRLAVNAGSILEDEDQLGMAHFVEHMAFNGTTSFEKQELVDYLESVGTRFGPDLNAYTSFDETVYMLQVRTDSIELFDKGMLILKDWASGISFEHAEIDKERGVVISEWRTRLSPDQRMQQETFPVVYSGSRYAERLPIGKPEIIDSSDYAVFKRFYKDWYRPDLMAVVVVGDINPVRVESQVKTWFSSIPEATDPREREEYSVPPHEGTKVVVASDDEASFTNVRIINKLPKVKIKTMEDFRQSLLRSAYNGMLSARLEEITKQADPPFIFSYSGYGGDVGDIDSYSSFALAPEGKATAALETLMTENKRVLEHGFTTGELERQKKKMMESAERRVREAEKTESNQLAMRYVYNFLDENPIPGPQDYLEMTEKYLPGITVEEINALPEKWVSEDNRVIVVTGPGGRRNGLPTEQDISALVTKVDTTMTTPYVDDVVEGPLLSMELAPAPIVREDTSASTGIYTLELENGVVAYLKPTDFKNDQIILSATSEGGSSLYGDAEYFNAVAATGIIEESGIGNFSATQLDKFMAGKTASVRPYISSYYEGLSGSCSPENMDEMFQMVYLYFTDVRKDEEAFNSYINKQIGIYDNLLKNPDYYFNDYISKVKYRGHPRVGFPKTRKWKSVELDTALAYYKDRFADASDFAFTIVGAFDVDEMKKMVSTYLGNLPVVDREETYKDLNINPIPGTLKKRIERGIAPKSLIHMYYSGDFEYNAENAYHLNSAIDYLRIKLREKLREDMGGVYGVRISGGGTRVPDEKYSITISFNSEPDKVDALIEAAREVIMTAKEEGPSEKDMIKVIETQRQTKIKNMENNNYWVGRIEQLHNEGKSFDHILMPAFEEMAGNLTADDIKNAIVMYFGNNYIEMVMNPKEETE